MKVVTLTVAPGEAFNYPQISNFCLNDGTDPKSNSSVDQVAFAPIKVRGF